MPQTLKNLHQQDLKRAENDLYYQGRLKMTEGYCVKCKKKVEMKDAKESKTSKGTKIAKGKCHHCGTTVCRMGGLK